MKKLSLISVLFVFQMNIVIGVSAQAQTFDSEDQKAISENMTFLRKNMKSASEDQVLKVAKYLAYIKLTPKMSNYKKEVTRLLESSLQFILCDDIENIECLEASPIVKPSTTLRIDTQAGLGKPVNAGQKLDIEYYFTSGWYDNFSKKQKSYKIPESTVAKKLAEKIKSDSNKAIYFAMYGIDDIQGSMSSVFHAVQDKVESRIPIKAVVDVSDSTKPNDFIRDYDLVKNTNGTYKIINMPGKIDLSYIKPDKKSNWAFAAPPWAESFLKDAEKATAKMSVTETRNYLNTKFLQVDKSFEGNADVTLKDAAWIAMNKKSNSVNSTLTRMAYQYDGTMDFLRLINKDVSSNDEARGHIEFPYSGIMHNKFVVFETALQKSVWTGTANISRSCMGSEENANVAIYIKNDEIAQAFKDEFVEMFGPAKLKAGAPETGSFHNKKRPNTRRYFTFEDGTEVRVHFSPTDDAEHKVILPMLYSARKGDILRISMFGSGGYELVRALQAAVARGVVIKIAVDTLSGAGVGSWVKSTDASLFDENPFKSNPSGSIEIRKSAWSGLNHHKTASLTRVENGRSQPEIIIIGSQNWSTNGNDTNDENVVTISNKNKPLEIITAFNQEFDEKIWKASIPLK